MELAEARALGKDKTDKDITVRHLISVEGVMWALARRLGQDEGRWALAGLFYDWTKTAPPRTQTGPRIWRPSGCARPQWRSRSSTRSWPTPPRVRTDLMAKAVVHGDAIAGLLVAAALVRPERSKGMKVSSVKKRLKERSFTPG